MDGTDGPLAGLRVIDCSEGYAGPMAGMYLADFGADVIKAEPQAGERGRSSPGFPLWNRNKRSVTANLDDAAGRLAVLDLLATADACIFSQPPGRLRRAGLESLELSRRYPELCCLHMPAFAARGAGSETPESLELLAAATGVGMYQQADEPVPTDPVISHLLAQQAIWGAGVLVAALLEREASGLGQVVTAGGLQAMVTALSGQVGHLVGEEVVRPFGGRGGIPTYRIYECADGLWMFVAGLTPAFRVAALEALGVLDELLGDPRLGGDIAGIGLPEHAEWAIEVIGAAFCKRPRTDWLRAIRAAGCPCAPVGNREDWLRHPQLAAIGMWVTLNDPVRGPVQMPGLPIQLARTPAAIRRPAPLAGEHDGRIEPHNRHPLTAGSQAASGGPLAGVRVLDLGAIVAGTYGASLLADFGADVIKIEPLTGDNLRPLVRNFQGYNLGKRGIALDISSDAGRAAFYRLVRKSDVVIDNFRPGVLERLRADYASLRAMRPAIISVSATGYGECGPLGEEPGFDPMLQAMSGMMRAQGGNGRPLSHAMPVTDVGTAATVALGALLALYHRRRTGEGQRVTTSLAAQSLMMQSREVVQYAGRPPAPVGSGVYQGPSALDRYYATAEGWIRLLATAPEDLDRLSRALRVRLAAAGSDRERQEVLSRAFGTMRRDAAVELLERAGIACAPARALSDLPRLEAVWESRLLERFDTVAGEQMWVPGAYATFSRTQRVGVKAAPGLGEHTAEVLAEAGYSPEEVSALLGAGFAAQGGPLTLSGG